MPRRRQCLLLGAARTVAIAHMHFPLLCWLPQHQGAISLLLLVTGGRARQWEEEGRMGKERGLLQRGNLLTGWKMCCDLCGFFCKTKLYCTSTLYVLIDAQCVFFKDCATWHIGVSGTRWASKTSDSSLCSLSLCGECHTVGPMNRFCCTAQFHEQFFHLVVKKTTYSADDHIYVICTM